MKVGDCKFSTPLVQLFPTGAPLVRSCVAMTMTRRAKVVVRLFATFASQDPRCQFKDGRSCLTDRREMIRR
jgi:hypothetical protein